MSRVKTSQREAAGAGGFRAIGVCFLLGYFFFAQAKKK
jgi:hypothetical protein